MKIYPQLYIRIKNSYILHKGNISGRHLKFVVSSLAYRHISQNFSIVPGLRRAVERDENIEIHRHKDKC